MLHLTYPLLTERLVLRPFRDDDLDAFHAIQSRPDVVRYLYWEPKSRDEVREMLGRRMLQTAIDNEGDGLHLAADLRTTGELIGHFSLYYASQEHRQGEIGFVLHPEHRGHGYATEGSRLMLRFGFEDLGLHRIIGRCDARNTPSARVMERLGMRREAHLIENEFIKGEWTDEFTFAMLDREWRARSMSAPSPAPASGDESAPTRR
jgi:RimJ/RimL family protein N-acetyltransferase